MRQPYSPAIQMALGSLGVLSLAQLAGAAEASSLDAHSEPCPSCTPATEESERTKKPVAVAVIPQPADPVAKQSPEFSASRFLANAETAVVQGSSPASSGGATAGDAGQPAAVVDTAQTTAKPGAAPDGSEAIAEAALISTVGEGSPDLNQGTMSEAREEYSAGVDESGLELTQREAGLVGSAHPTGADGEDALELGQGEAGLVGSAHPTGAETGVVDGAHPTGGDGEDALELTQREADLVGGARPTVAEPQLPAQANRNRNLTPSHLASRRSSGLASRSAIVSRSTASGSATAKRPISLPQVVSHAELSSTDVMSVWNRSIPPRGSAPAQHWHRHLPPEAMPAAVVQAPVTRASSALPSPEDAQAVSPPTEIVHPRRVTPSAPMLPVFESPRTKARANRPGGDAPRLVTARAELAAVSTASQDLLAPQDVLAQAESANETQREDLLIDPLATDPVPTVRYAPSPNAGIPSAFGAAWGDLFASVTVAGADRIRNEVDSSISAGLGLGNPRTAVGVELAYNLLSIRNFAENGSFEAKVHREIFANDTTQAAAAVGWNNFVSYGDDVAGSESGVYGVVSAAHLLQPNNPANRLPITGTLGVGGGSFSDEGSDVGVLAGVGLQVDPRLSLNAAWSGVGLNVGASVVPIPEIPLTLTAVYGDVTNNTAAGSVATLTIGYGFNFGPRF
jgi:hypothetical protein